MGRHTGPAYRPTSSPILPLSEDELGLTELDTIAVVQEPRIIDRDPVDPSASARGVVPQEIALAGRLDLGVPAGDQAVAEESDLGVLVEPQRRGPAREQVEAAFLAAGGDLHPGPPQDLLDQGE